MKSFKNNRLSLLHGFISGVVTYIVTQWLNSIYGLESLYYTAGIIFGFAILFVGRQKNISYKSLRYIFLFIASSAGYFLAVYVAIVLTIEDTGLFLAGIAGGAIGTAVLLIGVRALVAFGIGKYTSIIVWGALLGGATVYGGIWLEESLLLSEGDFGVSMFVVYVIWQTGMMYSIAKLLDAGNADVASELHNS